MGKYLRHIAVVLLLLLLGTYSCELEKIGSCPCIQAIEPSTARAGDVITLTGDFENFNLASDKITVGEIGSLTNLEKEGGELIGTVPPGVASDIVPITIKTNGCPDTIENCKSTFNYEKVVVTGISPNMGEKENPITITGSNFNTQDPSLNKVMFGSVQGTVDPDASNENNLVVTVPIGAETGDVTVSVDGLEANAGQFTYKYSVVGPVEVIGVCDGTTQDNFRRPTGIAVSSSGDIFVADDDADQIFRIFADTDVIETFAGKKGFSGTNSDNTGLDFSLLDGPLDIAIDKNDNLYVTDTDNNQIRRIDFASQRIFNYAENLVNLKGVTVDKDNNVYFSNLSPVIKIILATNLSPTDFAGSFNIPFGLAVDENQDVFVADTKNHKIKYIKAGSSMAIDFAGSGDKDFQDGPASDASFNEPTDVQIDSKGNVFVVDRGNNRIRVITTTMEVYTLDGSEGNSDCTLGYLNPQSLALFEDNGQNILYIADTGNKVIKKLKYE